MREQDERKYDFYQPESSLKYIFITLQYREKHETHVYPYYRW